MPFAPRPPAVSSRLLLLGLLDLALARCHPKPATTAAATAAAPGAPTAPPNAIAAADISGYPQAVSSDETLGRKPFTEGEARVMHYLAAQFQQLGLQPAGPNGSYCQHMYHKPPTSSTPPGTSPAAPRMRSSTSASASA